MNECRGRILVVDDELAIRDAISTYFETFGYLVTAAENGVEALDHIKSKPYDIIILDIKMPYVDGKQFSETLHHEHVDIPILVITAVENRVDIPHVAGVLLKTFSLDTLKRRVEEILLKSKPQ